MIENDNPGKVVLLKPHPNGSGRMLPKGQIVSFEVWIARKLIREEIAIKWTPDYEYKLITYATRKTPKVERLIIKEKAKKRKSKIIEIVEEQEDKGVKPINNN